MKPLPALLCLALAGCGGAASSPQEPASVAGVAVSVCVIYDAVGNMAFGATTANGAIYTVVLSTGTKTGQTQAQLEALLL